MSTAKFIIILVWLATILDASCRTLATVPEKSCNIAIVNGTCIPAKSCRYVLDLIKSGDLEGVRRMGCGFQGKEAKVCCPNGTNQTNSLASTVAPKQPDPFPGKSICGLSRGTYRIIPGEIADIDEFPWLARIKYSYNENETYSCSGSLINNRYIVTTASCVSNYEVLNVRLGEWDINTDQDCTEDNICNDNPIDINVKKAIIHPGYIKTNIYKDNIALLQLENPVNFTEWIEPICLPTTALTAAQDYYKNGRYVTAGWGITNLGKQSHVKLKEILNAVPIEECIEAIQSIHKNSSASFICASAGKSKANCKEDPGGPLFKEYNKDQQINWYLYGVSHDLNCATPGLPGVYTRTNHYIEWMREVILENEKLKHA